MKLSASGIGLGLILCFINIGSCGSQEVSLAGDWIGQIDFGGQWQRLNLHIVSGAQPLAGTIDLPQQRRFGVPLSRVDVEASHLTVEWKDGSVVSSCDGQVAVDITGEFKSGSSHGAF